MKCTKYIQTALQHALQYNSMKCNTIHCNAQTVRISHFPAHWRLESGGKGKRGEKGDEGDERGSSKEAVEEDRPIHFYFNHTVNTLFLAA